MSTSAAKTGRTDARRKGLRAFLAVTFFFVSALMQATVAPHAAMAVAEEFCIRTHTLDPGDKSPSGAPAHGGHAHCGACPIAAAPLIPVKPPIAQLEQPPATLVYFDGWPFEPRERRRSGETRSRAPPALS
jgi:hypothetical protein